jgi:hypothetical protein
MTWQRTKTVGSVAKAPISTEAMRSIIWRVELFYAPVAEDASLGVGNISTKPNVLDICLGRVPLSYSISALSTSGNHGLSLIVDFAARLLSGGVFIATQQ